MNFLISFCFFFCLLLFLYFNRYQADLERSLAGEADFQPWVYLGSIAGFYLLHWIFCRVKRAWVMALADLAVVLCFCLLLPIRNERYLLGLALSFYVLADCVQLGKLDSRDDREMEIHFSGKSNFYWGLGILLLLIGHYITARHGEIGLSSSSAVCMGWMLGAFFVYLILLTFQRYQYMFYHYFYKRKSMDRAVYGQTRKILAFILLVTGTATGLVFAASSLLTKILEPWLSALVRALAEAASLIGIPVGNTEYASWFDSGKSGIKEILDEKHGAVIQYQARDNTALRLAITGILVLLLVLAAFLVIYLVLRKLAETKIPQGEEGDEIRVTDSAREKQQAAGRRFGWHVRARTANEKVRYDYRKLISAKNRKQKIQGLGKLTAGEIQKAVYQDQQEQEWLKEVTAVYDQARYSGKNVKDEDAARVRVVCQKMQQKQG